MYKIHLLPAQFGDAILVEYGTSARPRYILIDGGPYFGYDTMIERLQRVAPKLKTLELLVVTHIDIDHIDGIIRLLNQKTLPFKVKEIWFNGYDELSHPLITGSVLGALQGEYLSALIKKQKLKHNHSFNNGPVVVSDPKSLPVIKLTGGFEITLLAPSVKALQKLSLKWKKEIEAIEAKKSVEERWAEEKRYGPQADSILGSKPDSSVANASSIAFIGSFKGASCLFAGDAPTAELKPVVEHLIKKNNNEVLEVSAWKLAHHGSAASTLPELMQIVHAPGILVSTNGSRFKHPDKKCIENIITTGNTDKVLYFNYYSDYNSIWDDEKKQKKMKYAAYYPESEAGITIEIDNF